jgi:hypothetical protein
VGEYATAIATYNRLLRQDKVPAMLIDQVIANRRFSIDALKPAAEIPTKPGPIKVCVPFRDPGPELDGCIEKHLAAGSRIVCGSLHRRRLIAGPRCAHSYGGSPFRPDAP